MILHLITDIFTVVELFGQPTNVLPRGGNFQHSLPVLSSCMGCCGIGSENLVRALFPTDLTLSLHCITGVCTIYSTFKEHCPIYVTHFKVSATIKVALT